MKTERIKSIIRASWQRGFLLILFAIAGLALLPQARAVCQQGCDLNRSNTFLGDDALANNTDGSANTAIGAQALTSNTTGFYNEFLKEHRKVEGQEATISQLRSTVAQQQEDFQATVAQLTKRLDEQASEIQKVSAQLAVNRPTSQIISSNQ